MAFSETLADFFDTTHGFAVTATFNGSTSVNGVFDDEYFEDEAGQGAGAESSQPRFVCAAADVPGVVHGSTLLIGAATYHVAGVQPDGTGLVMLILERQ